MGARVKIGTKALSESVDHRQGYEVAAWYKTVRCEPQTVDVYAEIEDGQVVDRSLSWALKGTVADAHFPALFGGVAMTDGERPEEIGQEETVHVSPYAHAVAHSLLDGTASDGLKLDVEPLYSPFRGYDGQGSYTAGLYVEPSEEQRERSLGVTAALAGEPIPHTSPEATFGWAMAKQSIARAQMEEAKRTADIADYALRTYAPEHVQKPELESLEPSL